MVASALGYLLSKHFTVYHHASYRCMVTRRVSTGVKLFQFVVTSSDEADEQVLVRQHCR